MNDSNELKALLRPRARIMRTLGRDLISNESVAVIELVKNAYDADASRVLIRFVGDLKPGSGQIEVIDNGHGMNLATITTVWLEPATVSKKTHRLSEKLRRRYLGEKGIGRFASARLAEELEVFSRREGDWQEAYAYFDWRQFDNDERYLDEVQILTETRHPLAIAPKGATSLLWTHDESPSERDLGHGTVLRMSHLRTSWGGRELTELTRGLSRLMAPGETGSGDFEIFLELPEELSQFSKKIEPPAVLDYPHYIVRGNVEKDGSYHLTYDVVSLGETHEYTGKYVRVRAARGTGYELRTLDALGKPKGSPPPPADALQIETGPLTFEIRVWDRDELGNVIQQTNSTIKDIRRDLDAVAGVNIYRDGFRVLPYGEPHDDWLRLDLRRVQNPTLRLSNNQVHGVISITADENPNLRDQSNREGLEENQGVTDLRDVMSQILSRLEELRYAARPRDQKPMTSTAVTGLFAPVDFSPLKRHLANAAPNDKTVQTLIEDTERSFTGQLKEIQAALSRYQRLATLGQLIDHVLHEGRQPIASINNEAFLGIQDAKPILKSDPQRGELLTKRFSHIRKQGDILSIAFKRMEPFGGRRRGRPAQLYLEHIIRDAFDVFKEDIARLKVKVDLPTTETLVRVDPAEMQEVIINLLQNSLHWLQQVSEDARSILVEVARVDSDHVDIYFSDSGPGVSDANRERIFEPYFSTRPDGVGLGLAIVGEIVSSYYGGALQLLNHGPLNGANFLVTLRKRV
jgi:signal transduction histidine kinase